MKKTIVLSVLSLLCLSAAAQSIKINTKFGSVSDEEVNMTTYPADTSASVLILHRHHEIEIYVDGKSGLMQRETIVERIKILKESGKDYPDYKIIYSVQTDPNESVSEIKVTTWNMEGGKKVKSALARNMIFNEKYDESHRSISFSAPDVRVGSVVEVRYTFRTPRVGSFGTLYLQKYQPVNISELVVQYPEMITFNKMTQGAFPVKSDRTSEGKMTMMDNNRYDYTSIKESYVAYDVPAMKEEPFMYYPDKYRLAMDYELSSFSIPGQVYKSYSTTWDAVDKIIYDDGIVKEFCRKTKFEDQVKAIVAQGLSEEETIAAVRRVVLDAVRWDKTRTGIVPETGKATREGEADAPTLSALVACALKEAGFTVSPVFYRPRTYGPLKDYHVALSSYRAVLLKVVSPSGKVHFMDVVDNNAYLDVLPANCLVDRGRSLAETGLAAWENLAATQKKNLLNVVVNLTPHPDGEVEGKTSVVGYNLCSTRLKYNRDKFQEEEEYVEDLEKEEKIEVVSLSFKGQDEWSPECSVDYSFTARADVAGDRIYLKPFFSRFHDAAAFRSQERKFPVEFPYTESINISCSVAIPQGYEVESLPQSTAFSFPDLKSQAVVRWLQDANMVVVRMQFKRDESFLPVDKYGDLRLYWEQLCNIYDSTIVLKKI